MSDEGQLPERVKHHSIPETGCGRKKKMRKRYQWLNQLFNPQFKETSDGVVKSRYLFNVHFLNHG